ncbi:restriction endonuclease subunit S [Psychrobacter sp. ANT_H56B]|nr:restriction endonuclease subunit S [Psychrobacter sp. ANT_H56B]
MPQGWQVTKLKYLIKNLESGVSVNAADYPKSEGEFGVLKTSCVYTREFRAEENKTVFEEELSRVKCPVRAGSIIISRMNTPDLVGAAVYVTENYSNLYLPDRLWQTVYNDDEAQSSKYLHYFMYLRGFRDQISNFAEGASSSMQSISKEDFLSINILLPTRDEQEGVANFLDHETAQIDTLIEKQQTLIQLLKDKRQAVISHAVTKGLNPDAPMKDSGVEWLGDVPEHWEVLAISKLTQKITNGYVGPTRDILVKQGVPYVQATHIKRGNVNFDDAYFVTDNWSKKHSKSILKKGDVLVVQTGAGTGDIGLVTEREEGYNCHALIILQPTTDLILGSYLSLILQSSYGYSTLYSIRTGGMHPHLNCGEVRYVKVPTPTIDEQQKIVEYIENMKSKFDELTRSAEKAIQLMQERRTALISAAVTGKIDVRGWQVPQ